MLANAECIAAALHLPGIDPHQSGTLRQRAMKWPSELSPGARGALLGFVETSAELVRTLDLTGAATVGQGTMAPSELWRAAAGQDSRSRSEDEE